MKKSQSYYWNILYTSEKYPEFEGWAEAKGERHTLSHSNKAMGDRC